MVRLGAGAVVNDVLAPAVPNVAVRIGEAGGNVDVEFLGARLVAEYRPIGAANRRAVRRLDLRMMECSFLKIEPAARIERETIRRMVRVGRVQARQHADAQVGLAVALGVLEE